MHKMIETVCLTLTCAKSTHHVYLHRFPYHIERLLFARQGAVGM